MQIEHGDYELDDNPDRVDRDAVWAFLSTEAYWGKWRTRDVLERQLDNAWRVAAAYHKPTGKLVGFARAISDGEAFAYLADVFVTNDVRGNGLGKELVRLMVDLGPGHDFRWTLHTWDAHGLYKQFGFTPPDDTFLERPASGGKARPPRE
jgi:GNAT superfamily N-acetyltransferase